MIWKNQILAEKPDFSKPVANGAPCTASAATEAKLLASSPPIKKPCIFAGFFYWGRCDSNTRSPKTGDLQSPAIAAMRHPQELGKGCWRKDLNPQPSAYKADALPLSYTSLKVLKHNMPQLLSSRGNCKTHLSVKIALLKPFASLLLSQPLVGWLRRMNRGGIAATLK